MTFYEPNSQKGLFGNIFLWVLGVILIIGVASAIVFITDWGSAPVRGKLQARQQINSGSYRIAAYDHFFDLCASVQSKEGSIAALQQELKTKPPQDRVTQINASITALRAARIDDIRQYNADAAKSYTEGQFRASSLPYQLNVNDKETTCVVG